MTASNAEEERWHDVQVALGSLITGRARADGTNWENAHENMLVYLKVCFSLPVCAAWPTGRLHTRPIPAIVAITAPRPCKRVLHTATYERNWRS